MKKPIMLIILFCIFACMTGIFAQSTILLEADYWMPFNGDGVKEIGYMLEIAREVFVPLGYKVEFKMVPWSRAVAQAREGTSSGVIGAFAGDAEGFVFPAEEQGFALNNFFVKAGNPWVYSGIESLNKIRLGVIGSYSYSDELDAYIKKNPSKVQLIYGETPMENLIQMLLLDRIDTIIEDKTVMLYTLAKMKLSGKIILADTTNQGEKLYIAFSPSAKNSVELAKILSNGMKTLRQSGKLAKILAKYGLVDWK